MITISFESAVHTIAARPLLFDTQVPPERLFSLFQAQPWSMWLDSNNSEHCDSRFDIMVFSPAATLVTSMGETLFENIQSGEKNTSLEDPLAILERAQHAMFSQITINTLNIPFHGGAIGYFSYDLGRYFEKLPQQAIQDISSPDMAVGIYYHALVYDRKEKQYFLVCPEGQHQDIIEQLHLGLKEQITEQTFALTNSWQSNMSKQAYCDKFDKVQQYLLDGDCYQINLAQRFTASYTGSEFAAYLKLRAANKAPFSAYLSFPDQKVLSISPERFLKVKDKKVQTKPIKGTRPRSNDPQQDKLLVSQLRSSTKDRAENLMIVDLLRNDISRVCRAGSVKVPHLFEIESFPAVHHLVSTVEGELDAHHTSTDLLRAAFPGGSITGAPKIRAMEIIEELEPHRRSVYCGSIGYLSACGNMDSSITIRTLICQNNHIHCWAGGGLVADSEADSEYQETFDKVAKILPILSQT